MTTDDKRLTRAFLETTVELKRVLDGQRIMDGTSRKDSSGSICCPFFAKDQLESVRMLSWSRIAFGQHEATKPTKLFFPDSL